MQKIGLSDLSKILYDARAISPLTMGKIKMGGSSRSFGVVGAKHAWGANFDAFAAHFVVY